MRSWKEICVEADRFGQGHLIKHASTLSPDQQNSYRQQLEQLDFAKLRQLTSTTKDTSSVIDFNRITPPPIMRFPKSGEDRRRKQQAQAVGETALRAGKIAIILVAGGQGTRLGHPGPKGTYPIGPITQRSLFQIHAEKVLALSRKYDQHLPLLIMTSQENDVATKEFFSKENYFGLSARQVTFFIQGMLPALDAETGQVLLKAPGEIALSPNGHGGVIQALYEGGHLNRLEQQGISDCFYFQVDNPLVKVADPVFLGHHLMVQAEMSLKVLAKLYPNERLGNLIEYEGKMKIIEYTELPISLAEERDENGELRIWAGSPALHFFQLSFLQRLAVGDVQLPYHAANKIVPYLDALGKIIRPAQPNALKFEMFIFDALPLVQRVAALETSRREEFEPLKNATGENSIQSVRQALTDNYALWLEKAGACITWNESGHVTVPLEISPLVALDSDDLIGKITPELVINQPLAL